jgi:hypothetical protein
MQASSALQRLGAGNRRFRPPLAPRGTDLPLPKTPKRTILASQRLGIRGMSTKMLAGLSSCGDGRQDSSRSRPTPLRRFDRRSEGYTMRVLFFAVSLPVWLSIALASSVGISHAQVQGNTTQTITNNDKTKTLEDFTLTVTSEKTTVVGVPVFNSFSIATLNKDKTSVKLSGGNIGPMKADDVTFRQSNRPPRLRRNLSRVAGTTAEQEWLPAPSARLSSVGRPELPSLACRFHEINMVTFMSFIVLRPLPIARLSLLSILEGLPRPALES